MGILDVVPGPQNGIIRQGCPERDFDIDEMLLRLYYIYEKSLKKCRELDDVVSELKQCVEFESGGIQPVRASGSRWVTHKLSAMKRVVSKFGEYTHCIITR